VTGTGLTLTINGSDVVINAPEDATLLEVLRDRVSMTGTRYGCGEERCGACMVLIDGRPEFSCTRQAEALEGRRIETIESLKSDDPILKAFVEHQAAQCTFCLPGIIMSSKALLAHNSAPTKAEVLDALEPHLCRCGAHNRIVDAVLSVTTS